MRREVIVSRAREILLKHNCICICSVLPRSWFPLAPSYFRRATEVAFEKCRCCGSQLEVMLAPNGLTYVLVTAREKHARTRACKRRTCTCTCSLDGECEPLQVGRARRHRNLESFCEIRVRNWYYIPVILLYPLSLVRAFECISQQSATGYI